MEKTKKLQLEDFTENEFFGTQEQKYLKAQVREELKEQGFIIDSRVLLQSLKIKYKVYNPSCS